METLSWVAPSLWTSGRKPPPPSAITSRVPYLPRYLCPPNVHASQQQTTAYNLYPLPSTLPHPLLLVILRLALPLCPHVLILTLNAAPHGSPTNGPSITGPSPGRHQRHRRPATNLKHPKIQLPPTLPNLPQPPHSCRELREYQLRQRPRTTASGNFQRYILNMAPSSGREVHTLSRVVGGGVLVRTHLHRHRHRTPNPPASLRPPRCS